MKNWLSWCTVHFSLKTAGPLEVKLLIHESKLIFRQTSWIERNARSIGSQIFGISSYKLKKIDNRFFQVNITSLGFTVALSLKFFMEFNRIFFKSLCNPLCKRRVVKGLSAGDNELLTNKKWTKAYRDWLKIM